MYQSKEGNINNFTKEDLFGLLPDEWFNFVGEKEFEKNYWDNIINILNSCNKFYPNFEDIFNTFSYINPEEVKVVILGQDPYINPEQAHGLSFSVKKGLLVPPSLRNIYKEILRCNNIVGNKATDYLAIKKHDGDLTELNKQGVLLLNSILTVRANKSNSHANIGWENFTNKIIQELDKNNNCVFIAMGKVAEEIIKNNVKLNQIISTGHPSPLNTINPFYGCNCFNICNEILTQKYKLKPIDWMIMFK